ncbi:MAG: 30S ribosomal protein S7 [Candidatus Paceibacterota bacterium]|jgi:small subunit ribosomal protein S7
MRRKHRQEKQYDEDLIYKSALVTRFIHYLMKDGKKSTAQRIFYKTMEIIKKQTKQNPLEIFNLAIKNVSPDLEVKTRRIGGANYQVPQAVTEYRKITLACRWLINASQEKKGKSIAEKLAEELILASKNEGAAIKKKLDVHRIAESNRAFARFSF